MSCPAWILSTTWFSLQPLTVGSFFAAGIWLTLDVILFAPICIVAWTVFLPPLFWDTILNRSRGGNSEARAPGPCRRYLTQFLQPAGPPGPRWRSLLKDAFVTFCLVVVIVWNIRTTEVGNRLMLPRTQYGKVFSKSWMDPFANYLGLRQEWDMFSGPNVFDGWYVTTKIQSIIRLLISLTCVTACLPHNGYGLMRMQNRFVVEATLINKKKVDLFFFDDSPQAFAIDANPVSYDKPE